jgi:hypothetical protein
MLKVTHVNSYNGSIIINNGSCVSTVVYDDYSGLRQNLVVDSKEFKKFIKLHHYKEIV